MSEHVQQPQEDDTLIVMEKARDLALTLIASAPYRQMKQAEAEVALDPAAAAILEEFEQMQELVRKAMAGEGDIAQVSKDFAQLQLRMKQNPKIVRLDETRRGFRDEMEQVNRLLSYYVGGGEPASCSGDCSTCGSCG